MRARDVLSGRKIDTERGCVIKAEMAKKNLHTKRGLSCTDPSRLYTNGMGAYRRRATAEGLDLQYYKMNGLDYAQPYDGSFSSDYYSTSAPLSYGTHYDNDAFDPFAPSNPALDVDILNSASTDPFYQSESCLSPKDEYESKLPSLFGTSQSSRGFSSVLYNSDELLSKSLGSMSLSDFPGQDSFSGRSSSFSYTAPPGADQNPPCNTLYVGNLPNDVCEDELRQMFQCCLGYKRLSFKTRPNGPMCFVEV
jgi:hypothetical protein